MEIFDFFVRNLRTALVTDLIDVLIVAFFMYKLIKLIKDTTAEKLIKGLFWLIIVMQISDLLRLNTIHYVLQTAMEMGLLAVIILFQPELRKMLEQVGKSSITTFMEKEEETPDMQVAIMQIVEACSAMSWSKTGALIVFERQDKLNDIAKTGTSIDAKVSSELVKNIFYPKSPLHDGAMIIRNGRILSAACVLPLSENQSLSKDLGTRHRASVGMSEQADTICVTVSEETGSISVAIKGMLKRHLAPDVLEKLLIKEFIQEEEAPVKKRSLISRWKEKNDK